MTMVPAVSPWSSAGVVPTPPVLAPAPQPQPQPQPLPAPIQDQYVPGAGPVAGMQQPVPAAAPMDPAARPGAHTLNVIGAVVPVRMVPEMMNRAAASAVARSADAGLMLKASVEGIKGLKPTFGAALGQALNPLNLFRSLKLGALISFPLAFVQNFIDMRKGQLTTNQMLAGTVADGIGYTVAGSLGTAIGGLVGSVVPVAGTLVGMLVGGAIGILGSELYDKAFKPDFRKTVEAKMFQG
ncbi:MAG: hypothetical protein VKO21_08205 [Candidatus Sericytochromatia bacterium]|nr:hypothetical protein [Candidatus Sericytochromatia bacterium]